MSDDSTRAEGHYAQKLMAELSAIEFNTASDIQTYTRRVRDLTRALAVELEYGAEEIEARLRGVEPTGDDTALTVARKARTTARHLRRSAEATRSAGIEAVRTWGSLRKHFESQMDPQRKPKKKIDLKS